MELSLTCEDFINAGLWRHEDCCKMCHKIGHETDRPRKFKPDIIGMGPARIADITFYCCCGFVGKKFHVGAIEAALQIRYGRLADE